MQETTKDILKKYINFFKEREHVEIPNVSLVPKNDPTLLFVNSGMFPLVPYLMGEPHPEGDRLVNVQRCVRFEDIEEVGDNRHTTAFHMLGNWSLNDYFKEKQLEWVYTFLFDVLKIEPAKTYASVFSGNKDAPRDEDTLKILKKIFSDYGIDPVENERIFFREEDNWWQRGDTVGELGGPDSEIFYYIGDKEIPDKALDPSKDEDILLEIGNSVFMEYVKTENGWKRMGRKNVDFGGGLERMALVLQGKNDIFETDNFWPLIETLENISGLSYGESIESTRHMRIIADHVRSAVFLVMDGVEPSNKDQGYILRRLIRRIVRSGKSLGLDREISTELASLVVEMFKWLYPELEEKEGGIKEVFQKEEKRFRRSLKRASKEIEKYLDQLSQKASEEDLAKQAFTFYQSLGYPEEIFLEDLRERGVSFDTRKFYEIYQDLLEAHKERSRKSAAGRFKGGLADSEENTVKYHTATHILHEALRRVLGDDVEQKGSNITSERLRFDFSFHRPVTEEEIIQIEGIANSIIKSDVPVKSKIMGSKDAIAQGVNFLSNEKYGDKVKVYFVGESLEKSYSKEFCGGPHVDSTGELSSLNIYRQKKIGRGTIRIYAKFDL